MIPEKTKEEARQILGRAHGFSSLSRGTKGVLAYFKRHSCVQVDSIDVAGRNQDFTLFSRVEDYRQEYLEDLLYNERRLFEYFCKMMSILPMEMYPLFKSKMKNFRESHQEFFDDYASEVEEIMDAAKSGPICSRDIRQMGKTEWGWGQTTRISNRLLTRLWVAGRLMVHHRKGRMRCYALPESIIPERYLEEQGPGEEESLVEIANLIMKSSRIVSPSKAPEQWNQVGKTRDVRRILNKLTEEGCAFTVRIQGWNGKLYCPLEDKRLWEDRMGREKPIVRFLAPLDPLLWNRALFECIYEHEYVWEVYKKKEERVYGYYCLPILFDNDYVGLIEPRFRSKDRVLEIRSFHLFDSPTERTQFAISFREEITRFMQYLGAKEMENKSKNKWLSRFL